MTLLHRFQEILDEYRQQLPEIEQRVAKNTSEIERLLAQNAEDQDALLSLARDIRFLEREIATMGEHVAEAPSPPPVQSSTDTRTEVDSLIKARREAEQAERERQQAGRRRQRSKPDPVKAARKAAKAAQARKPNPGATGRYAKDPLAVQANPHRTVNTPVGVKRPRLASGDVPDLDLSQITPTWLDRADAVALLLDEHGALAQVEIRQRLPEIMDISAAQMSGMAAFVTHCLHILKSQGRVIPTGEKRESKPGGKKSSAVWKLVSQLTPPERAAAGLPIDDDNYAGTTTRPTASSVSPGARITVESSQFEGKR